MGRFPRPEAGGARKRCDARDRIADEEGGAGEAGIGHEEAVPPQREDGGDVADLPWPLPLRGEDPVPLAVGAERDQFGVPHVVDDRAAVGEEAAGADALEVVVASVGAVPVAGLGGEAEGGGGRWGVVVGDDADAEAVGGAGWGGGGGGVGGAGDGRRQAGEEQDKAVAGAGWQVQAPLTRFNCPGVSPLIR